MLTNYIKIAIRNILRNRLHSFINIMGLTIGLACAIFLILFIKNELSYDRHHSRHDRIYNVQFEPVGGLENRPHGTSFPMGQTLKNEYSEIEESTTLFMSNMFFTDSNGETIRENLVYYADPGIFNIFDHKFIYGAETKGLNDPGSIVISKTFARKYFGNDNAVGKILSRKDDVDFIVTGVFEDLPSTSYIQYDALISMNSLKSEYVHVEEWLKADLNSITAIHPDYLKTFILLRPNSSIRNIEKDSSRFAEKYFPPEIKTVHYKYEYSFKPLVGLYLGSRPYPESSVTALQRVYIVSLLTVLLLIIACVNHMNLTTAKTMNRAMEVCVRKVLGADRSSLVWQFIGEAMIITTGAVLLALVLVELFMPFLNSYLGTELSLKSSNGAEVFCGLIFLILFVGFLSGGYPAFFLSSYPPAIIFKEGSTITGRGSVRKILVILQYTITVVIIICSIMLVKQLDYIRNKDLGYNPKDILLVFSNSDQLNTFKAFRETIQNHSGISAVSASSPPVFDKSGTSLKIEDQNGIMVDKTVYIYPVDQAYVDLYEMEILEGRNFNREMVSDQQGAVLINETLASEMGWNSSPIGKKIQRPSYSAGEKRVIGVVKDFHTDSLHFKVKPLMLEILPFPVNVLNIKIRPEHRKETIEFLKMKWNTLNTLQPFDYQEAEYIINERYRSEEMLSKILFSFSLLTIFISCLGLFGLSSFITENRTKEIGIRKVNGASMQNIVFHLTGNFLKLVLISCVTAWPISYWAMEKWLERYAYSIGMPLRIFLLGTIIVMIIASVTVSYHSIKAAMTDPVKALRYE